MSSITSTIGSGLSQFLHHLVANGSSANASSGTTTSSTANHHRHHTGGFEKLANAVTNALQAATTSSSSSDANKTITEALTKIFQNNSMGSTNDSESADVNSNNATPGASAISTLPASFAQMLQSFGVTAKQFESDLATAFKNAQQSGTADLSTAFKSFPAGSLVDAVG